MTSPPLPRWYVRGEISQRGPRMALFLRACQRLVRASAFVAMLTAFGATATYAQVTKQPPAPPGSAAATADPLAVPGFWDPRRRPERPDLSRISIIRFLTETDYPPFNYAGPDGAPTGLNVDLARLI